MKIICVTGALGSDVDKVADIFFAAGVQPALPLHQDPSFTLAGWHDKVIAAATGGDKTPTHAVKHPGRFWEQFATNLFMENMRQPLWGWGNTRSVWLLDFWQQFEPNLHFVLVYTSSHRALAQALAAEREYGADIASLMAAWAAHQKEILRFYYRNLDRTILVDAAECCAAPDALIGAVTARWNLELVLAADIRPELPAPTPLLSYLAEQLHMTHPELQALQQELESSLCALHPEQPVQIAGPDLFAVVDDYRNMSSAAKRTSALKLEVDALSVQLADITDVARELTNQKFESESTIAELRLTISERNSEATVLKAENIKMRTVSDQILLQMNQFQEELKHISAENKRLDEINLASERAIDELSKKLAQADILAATSIKELDAANLNRTAAEKERTAALATLALAKKELEAAHQRIQQLDAVQHNAMAAQRENDLLLVQLHKIQEEFERHFIDNKEAAKLSSEFVATLQKSLEISSSKIISLEKDKSDTVAVLTATKNTVIELTKKLTQLQVSTEALKKELNAVSANKAANEKEKTDNLTALATAKRTIDELNRKVVQLENYVRTLKIELDASNANKAVEKEKNEALTVLAAVRKELEVARQGIQHLEVKQHNTKDVQTENKLLLVQLHQVQEELEHYFLEYKNAVKQNGKLTSRWQRMLERNPAYCDYESLELVDIDLPGQRTTWRITDLNAAGQAYAELCIDAVIEGDIAVVKLKIQNQDKVFITPSTLDTLTTAQWMLLPKLCNVLDEALYAPTDSVAQLGETQRSALRAALAGLLESLDASPTTMRFDCVTLKREQINPDYEHLWLQLGNLSFGNKRWGDVEFRLACANVRPGNFGANPKLEFPSETSAALLGSWFAESFDDFGDKLELRFALPEAMDMSVWEKLSPADQTILKTLVAKLPLMLSRLDDGQIKLSRPFTDWQQLAGAVESILSIRTAAAVQARVPTTVSDMPTSPHAPEVPGIGMVLKGFI